MRMARAILGSIDTGPLTPRASLKKMLTTERAPEPFLLVRRVLRDQIAVLHRLLLALVKDDEVCRRLMTVPGVGPVVALTYRATVDVPARFRNSKAVGAVFGLTPSK